MYLLVYFNVVFQRFRIALNDKTKSFSVIFVV